MDHRGDPPRDLAEPGDPPRDLAELYRNHGERLKRYVIRSFGAGPPDPDDVVQAVFVRFAVARLSQPIANPQAFLFSMARNQVIDERRRQAVRTRHARDGAWLAERSDDIDAERVLEAKQRLAAVEAAVETLDPRSREMLLMNRIHGFNCAEIARRRGCSPTLVKQIIARGAGGLSSRHRGLRMSGPTHAENDATLAVAADWIVRGGEPGFTLEERRALERWRRARPEHERAYRSLAGIWEELPTLLLAVYPPPSAANSDEPGVPPPRRVRRAAQWVGALATAATLALVLVSVPGEEQPTRFATGVGQISTLSLADGSQAVLAPKTAIEIAFSASQRHVRLESGEVYFEVTRDAARPFVVESRASLVRVVGTHFDVKAGQNVEQVSVLQGVVEVRRKRGDPGAATTLRRGEQALVDRSADGYRRIRKVASDDPARFATLASGWREGWLSYDNARLAAVIEDLDRYYRPGIVLADPALGDLRVTASFRADRLRQFVGSLDQVLPVRVTGPRGGQLRITRTD